MAKVLMNLVEITANLAGRVIFSNLSLELQEGQRIGLVGPNGSGKSTLMKVMAGELAPEAGEIFRTRSLTWGRLPQEPVMHSERNVLEEALTALPAVVTVERQLDRLEEKMADPDVYENYAELEKVLQQHARALDSYERLGGERYRSTVEKHLDALGVEEKMWDTPLHVLSGGYKKLVLLAKLLVQQPQLLFLDEPDNHLDILAKENLEQIISGYPGCVVIISHDRYLLDEVATDIAELENGALVRYQGNYTAYTTEKELRRLRQQQLYTAQQKEIARIEAAIARFEQWASMVVNERHIKQARVRRKMLEEMDKVEKVVDPRRMTLALAGWRGSNKVIELEGVSKTLPNGRQLWKRIGFTLWHGDRVGLVGPNGAGKSMLLKQLLAPESVDDGQIKIGPSTKIGYYAQEQETLEMDRTPLQELRNHIAIRESAAVAFLTRFLFTYEQVRKPISNLSGGERSRLQLAKLVATRPNLLLLDEPTNNLDIASIEVLEEALEEFVGTVLVVSHDRYFLDRAVDRIIRLEDGRVTEFLGGYTDYIETLAPA